MHLLENVICSKVDNHQVNIIWQVLQAGRKDERQEYYVKPRTLGST
jgi:hypothetical protein